MCEAVQYEPREWARLVIPIEGIAVPIKVAASNWRLHEPVAITAIS